MNLRMHSFIMISRVTFLAAPGLSSPPGAGGTFAAIGARGQIAGAAAGAHRVVQVAIPIRDLKNRWDLQAGGTNIELF